MKKNDSSNDDVIVGSVDNDQIDGLLGNDLIGGLAGPDILSDGLGTDVLFVGADDDTFVGGPIDHDGDMIGDFDEGDQIVYLGSLLSKSEIEVGIDTTTIEVVYEAGTSLLTLDGNYDDGRFVIEALADGMYRSGIDLTVPH